MGQLLSMLGERIFHMRRHDVEAAARNKAVGFQCLKRLREHLFAHPADPPSQGAKAHSAVLKGQHHQSTPFAGHIAEQATRRAHLVHHIGGEMQIGFQEIS